MKERKETGGRGGGGEWFIGAHTQNTYLFKCSSTIQDKAKVCKAPIKEGKCV